MKRVLKKKVKWFWRRRMAPVWGAAIGLGALLIYWPGVVGLIPGLEEYRDLKPLRTADLRIGDFLHTWLAVRPPADGVPPICVVGVSNRGVEKLGPMPWPRETHAKLVRKLHDMGATAIAFDIFFDKPGSGDGEFARTCEEAGNVILPRWGEFSAEHPPGASTPRRGLFGMQVGAFKRPGRSADGVFRGPLREAAKRIYASASDQGHINVFYDEDFVARRVPVAVGSPTEETAYLPLGIVAAMKSRGIPTSDAVIARDALLYGETRTPLDASGCVLVNYHPFAKWIDTTALDVRAIETDVAWLREDARRAPIRFISYLDVLEGRTPPDVFRGAVVLVGQCIWDSREDVHVTPEGNKFGVFVQAMLLYTALTQRFLVPLSQGWTVLILFGVSLLLATLCFRMHLRVSTYVIVMGGSLLIGLGVLATLLAIGLLRRHGVVVEATPFLMVIGLNLLGGIAASTGRITREAARKGREMELLLAAGEQQVLKWPGAESSKPRRIPGAEQIEISTSLAERSAGLVIETFRQAVPCDGCVLYLADEGDAFDSERAIFDGLTDGIPRESVKLVAERFASETKGVGRPVIRSARDRDWPYANLATWLRTIMGVPVIVRGQTLAVVLMLNKRPTPTSREKFFDDEDLHLAAGLCYQAAALLENARRFRLEYAMFEGFARSLAKAIDFRDRYTHGHSERVAEFSAAIARELGLSDAEVEVVQRAATLHDVGKIGVHDAVLNKPGRLSDEEFDLIRSHAAKGYEILRGAPSFEPLMPGIRHHHERYDGKGYPDGLAGENIPLIARIIGAADAYDAMTSDRIYRKALPATEARRELLRNAGTQFDPSVVRAFLKYLHSLRSREVRREVRAEPASVAAAT